MKIKAQKLMPKLIWNWLQFDRAWLVGSAVPWYLAGGEDPKPRDWDLIIPYDSWERVCRSVSTPVQINSFGGLKTIVDGTDIDFWPGTLEEFSVICNKKHSQALRLHPYTLITMEK